MIMFDGHVHIYDCYDVDKFFAAAFENFSAAGAKLKGEPQISYFVLMAEATGVYCFQKLQDIAKGAQGVASTSFRVEESGESHSLFVYHDDFPSMRLIVCAGRQLITEEKLELLALMTEKDFADGLELGATVEAVVKAGGIPVCPWGAGKWMGQRGKVLAKYMNKPHARFYLGDSGGRPSFWSRPSLFEGEAVATKILSGSDPLPLVGQEVAVGSFGGVIDLDCPDTHPATYLREQFKDPKIVISAYGRPCCPMLFVKNQVALRLK